MKRNFIFILAIITVLFGVGFISGCKKKIVEEKSNVISQEKNDTNIQGEVEKNIPKPPKPKTPEQICQDGCKSLNDKINEKTDARAREIIASAGCSLGTAPADSLPTASGKIFSSNTEYYCQNLSSRDELSKLIAGTTNNPTPKDREFIKMQNEYKDNCPCIVKINKCEICPDGVNDKCPVYPVQSEADCATKGGVILK